LYLSTDDAIRGDLITQGGAFSVALEAGQTYYLHAVAADVYNWNWGFMGDFSLSDMGFTFSNGTQRLLTNTVDWTADLGTWGAWTAPTGTPYSYGLNSSPRPSYWSPPSWSHASIDPDAAWIWASANPSHGVWSSAAYGTAYFSTQLTSSVPEPETYVLMLVGLVLIGFSIRRAKHV
jgi:hypothetical protein